MTRVLVIALALVTLASVAEAQDPYTLAVNEALRALASGDVAGGRERLLGLVAESPARAAAHCHLGEAHRMAGELGPALGSYRECARLARQTNDAGLEARGLLGVAQTLTRQEGKLPQAKEAFAALRTFAEAHPDVVPVALVEARAAAVDAMIAADEAAAAVRTRREERARELAEAAETP
tara:strand:- start:804 stop:1343 length:540 start_codon:yes stop_codon:yes gene_type:complete